VSWPLPRLDQLRLVGSEEIFVYLNDSSWNRSGFSENRLYAGVNVRFNEQISTDLGYLNRFVSKGNSSDLDNRAWPRTSICTFEQAGTAVPAVYPLAGMTFRSR
jgi:Protein of unknown function (DUF2490)